MDNTAELLRELARAKVAFQLRTIEAVIRGRETWDGTSIGDGGTQIIEGVPCGLSLPQRSPP